MSDDSYTEVTTEGWGSRLMESIKGVLVGLVLFIVAFPVLFWNEGRAVRDAKGLAEAGKEVKTIDPARIDPAMDKKLIHFSGKATTEDTVRDALFGISEKAIRLTRTVMMYQYTEKKETRKEKQVGGSQKTITTYTYPAKWEEKSINSNSFTQPEAREKYKNPPMLVGTTPISSMTASADRVTVGAFTLPEELRKSITKAEDIAASEDALAKLPDDLKTNLKVAKGEYYTKTADPENPKVGDIKVGFKVVRPQDVSVIGDQAGSTLTGHMSSQGTRIFDLQAGIRSSAEMVAELQRKAALLTWILRLVGFLAMAIGLFMVFRPIAVLGDVVPFVGNLLGAGLGLFAGIVAFALSLITISIAWLFYRPIIGVPMLVVAIAALIGLARLAAAKRAAKAPAVPSARL